jgi:hypothetical protein
MTILMGSLSSFSEPLAPVFELPWQDFFISWKWTKPPHRRNAEKDSGGETRTIHGR